MTDRINSARANDAPLITSKKISAAVDAATDSLIDKPGQGDADTLIDPTVTINRPRGELFALWRDLTNLPAFMDNVDRIELLGGDRSRWVVKAPGETTVEWTAATGWGKTTARPIPPRSPGTAGKR